MQEPQEADTIQKKNLLQLMYSESMKLRTEPGEEETVYDATVRALDAHFTPKVNSAFERSQFRAMTQTSSEAVEQYITRLRQKAVFCDFHNIDENIRDQVIEKCYSQRLRRKHHKHLRNKTVYVVSLTKIILSYSFFG